ncbi:NAD(P)-binding protein [Xylaria arbuscula]|nr:NAD(P)-binding protein [Xylaria arbuscula]
MKSPCMNLVTQRGTASASSIPCFLCDLISPILFSKFGVYRQTKMGDLLVLSDSIVHDILINLSKTEILALRDVLADCLIDFSVGSEKIYQPPVGVVNRPEGQKCLFRPFTSCEAIGTKIVVNPAPSSRVAGALHGIIALCDSDGLPLGIINAEEVTGYRTALSALIPYLWRRYTDNIVVFGAGKQALWHLRLSLALRGSEIKSIVVINRTASRAETLVKKIKEENDTRWKSEARIEYLDISSPNVQRLLRNHLSLADAIFCTVGATEPLFPARYILANAKDRQPYVSAVGSWQPDMIELDPDLLHAAKAGPGLTEFASGSVLVDDGQGALLHSGEVIRSGLAIEDLVEVGEVESIRRNERDEWLPQTQVEEGLLIYKGVGVSTTDLAASNAILAFARKRQLGTTISDF